MARKKKTSLKPKIERQEILAETGRRSYEVLRLTRVKYLGNPRSFIDLRIFQKQDNDEGELYHPTRKGVQLEEGQFQRLVGKWTLVPALLFHPIIVKKSLPSFRREEFDTAVFQAFRSVEVRVRKLSGLSDDFIGTALMRKAFDAEGGPLSDKSMLKAERESLSHLFAGAIGWYKNPCSHREVNLSFNEAFEMILIASHLLQILDRVERKLSI